MKAFGHLGPKHIPKSTETKNPPVSPQKHLDQVDAAVPLPKAVPKTAKTLQFGEGTHPSPGMS